LESTVAEEAGDTGDRIFWAVFALSWGAYLGLGVAGYVAELHEPAMVAVGLALVGTAPSAALAFVVALNRRSLLRPEWSLIKTLRVHALVGVLFAASAAGAAMAISAISGLATPRRMDIGPGQEFMFRTVSGVLLYTIFAAVLMWSESIRRVHESHSMVAREAALRAEAEAKAIRAQFNPHFVFNTLHSLMLLVRADPATAERAIEDVATLIRYASILQRTDVDAVPLAKELEVARRYVALEKLRLEDRLCVTWAIDVEPGELTIPAFALQTLIENAIRHGLEPKPKGGAGSGWYPRRRRYIECDGRGRWERVEPG
jgi:hypothetical protein